MPKNGVENSLQRTKEIFLDRFLLNKNEQINEGERKQYLGFRTDLSLGYKKQKFIKA